MIRDLFGTVSDSAHEIRQNLLFCILSDTVSCSVIMKAVNWERWHFFLVMAFTQGDLSNVADFNKVLLELLCGKDYV